MNYDAHSMRVGVGEAIFYVEQFLPACTSFSSPFDILGDMRLKQRQLPACSWVAAPAVRRSIYSPV